MYVEIYKYVEGDENCEKGEYLGYVSLEEDDIYIDVDTDEMNEKLEELFSEPIIYSDGPCEMDKEIDPYTLEFFRVILTLLPDYGIRGSIKEEEDPYKNEIIDDPENIDDNNGLTEISPGMSMNDITDFSQGYKLDDPNMIAEEAVEDYI